MRKKKKVILSIGVLIVGILLYFCYGYIHSKNILDSITIQFHDIKVVEYGQPMESKKLIKSISGTLKQVEEIDVMKIGKQKIIFVVEKEGERKEFFYEVEVKDSQAPEILLHKEQDTLEYKQTFDALSYIVSVKDPIDGECSYQAKEEIKDSDTNYYTYQSDVDTSKAGEYQVRYIAVDKHGNRLEKTMTIVVKEEQPKTSDIFTPHFSTTKNRVIVIDPGHQGTGNSAKEAVGPGSDSMKAKVASGATGVSSGKAESLINLEVGLKLKSELEARGYVVIMTRMSQDVDISNQERALIGNYHNASAIIHLHCDSLDSSSARGAHTIAIASNNPYCPDIYSASSSLASNVITQYSATTGIKNRGVSYRNDLTGLNWSKVPSIYIEMGFISNSEEDNLLSSSTFQTKCAVGIANGIDAYYQ